MEPLWVQKWQCHLLIIFMALTETKLMQQSETKHSEWKCCIDDVLFSLSLADRDFFF